MGSMDVGEARDNKEEESEHTGEGESERQESGVIILKSGRPRQWESGRPGR